MLPLQFGFPSFLFCARGMPDKSIPTVALHLRGRGYGSEAGVSISMKGPKGNQDSITLRPKKSDFTLKKKNENKAQDSKYERRISYRSSNSVKWM